MNKSIRICPVCSGKEFFQRDVLWKDLIDSWMLSEREVEYINRQQGFHCVKCQNNLRSLGLAAAILREYQFAESLERFVVLKKELAVLEINQSGNLTKYLKNLPNYKLAEYPRYDLHKLDIPSEYFDLVIHSDTLEHIEYPERGLSECRRVLRKNGRCIFTVPIIVDRMNRSRKGLPPSYHGQSGVLANDQQVWTEFGSDVWKTVLMAGFDSCEIYAYEYPAALVLIARK